MSSLLLILLSSVLVSYFAIAEVPMLQPLISDDLYDSAVGVAVVTGLCIAVLSPLAWLVDHLVLRALHVDYLAPVLLVILTVLLVLLAESFLRRGTRWVPRPAGFLLLMSSQSVLFGVLLLSRTRSADFLQAIGLGIGAGGSFAVLLLAFTSLQLRLRFASIPAPFRMAPAALVTVGIMALAAMGLTGLIKE